MQLNGKQTIYQMIQLADRIRERGGEPKEPLWYKHEYLRRLERAHRRPHRGPAQRLASAPTTCWSTVRVRCWKNSARAGCRSTWPAAPTSRSSSRRPSCSAYALLRPAHLRRPVTITRTSPRRWSSSGSSAKTRSTGDKLLAFGDGYVEIENTKEAGGLAVAVASDEANNGSGRMDDGNASASRASAPMS